MLKTLSPRFILIITFIISMSIYLKIEIVTVTCKIYEIERKWEIERVHTRAFVHLDNAHNWKYLQYEYLPSGGGIPSKDWYSPSSTEWHQTVFMGSFERYRTEHPRFRTLWNIMLIVYVYCCGKRNKTFVLFLHNKTKVPK